MIAEKEEEEDLPLSFLCVSLPLYVNRADQERGAESSP